MNRFEITFVIITMLSLEGKFCYDSLCVAKRTWRLFDDAIFSSQDSCSLLFDRLIGQNDQALLLPDILLIHRNLFLREGVTLFISSISLKRYNIFASFEKRIVDLTDQNLQIAFKR